MDAAPEHRQRRLQLSLRSVLVLTLLLALGLGAYARFVRPYQIQVQARTTIQALGGSFMLEPSGQEWVRKLFGPDRMQDIVLVDVGHCNLTPEAFQGLLELPRVKTMVLGGDVLTDDRVICLSALSSLETLVLDSPTASPSVIRALRKHLPNTHIIVSQSQAIEKLPCSNPVVKYHNSLAHLVPRKVRRRATPTGPWVTLDVYPFDTRYREPSELWCSQATLLVADMRRIARMQTLEKLELPRTNTADHDLPMLATLPRLEVLNLADTQVTDAGLIHLRSMRNLKILYLHGTSITDEGISELIRLKGLQAVYLERTHVTAVGLSALASALPHAAISPVVRHSTITQQASKSKPLGVILDIK